MKVCVDLDSIDMRLAEMGLDAIRKAMNMPNLEMEDFLLFTLKRALYNEDKVDPKEKGH